MNDEKRKLLDNALNRAPSEHDLSRLIPLILPFHRIESGWEGPIVSLADLPFALAWAVRYDGNMYAYVTYEMAQYWEETGIDWPQHALTNMRELAHADKSNRRKVDENGKTLIAVMLNNDGIGPSRLLVPGLFEDEFGDDYTVAIPEETCAVAYRNDLAPEHMADVDGLIEHCYERGTNPMCPERFAPRRFWLSQVAVRLLYDE